MSGYSCTYIMQFCFYILYVHRDGHKDKGNYKGPIEYDTVAGEAASIKDSPTEVSYTATTQAPQYHYASTGPMKVKFFKRMYVHIILLILHVYIVLVIIVTWAQVTCLYVHIGLYTYTDKFIWPEV